MVSLQAISNDFKANGTWTSNRRGRKRKNLSPERWTPANRNGNMESHDDDLTEADDLSDADPEGAEEFVARDVIPRLPSLAEDPAIVIDVRISHDCTDFSQNGRPNPLSRSITDPVPRTARPRPAANSSRYNTGPTSTPNDPPRPSPSMKFQGNLGEVSPIAAMTSGKRRKLSPERPAEGSVLNTMPPPPSADATSSNFVPPSVVFDQSEFLAFLQKGMDQAHHAAKAFEMEKATLRQNYEASVSRANRRVHDAQEKSRWAQIESGEKIKIRERELNEKLKGRARDQGEEKEAMRKEFEREKKQVEEVQVKNIEALTRENEFLRRDLEHQRKQIEAQSQEYEREVSRLMGGQHQSRSTAKIQDIVEGLPMPLDGKRVKLDVDDRPASSEIDSTEATPAWMSLRQSHIDTFQKLVGDIEILSSSIEQMNKERENLTMTRTLADISRLGEESRVTVSSKEKAKQALNAFHSEAEALFNKLSVTSSTTKDSKSLSTVNGS